MRRQNNMDNTYICVYLLLMLPTFSAGNYVCLSCRGAISAATCSSVQTCGPHESCYAESFLTSNGLINYNFGCRDSQVCKGSPIIGRDVSDNVVQTSSDHVMTSRDDHVIETRADTTLLCSQCCTGDLCNAASCGQPGFFNKVCYDCNNQPFPDSCDIIKQCGYDEMCLLQLDADNIPTVYRTGCASNSTCEVVRQKLIKYASIGGTQVTDLGCNFACCDSNLCNTATCAPTSTAKSLTSASPSSHFTALPTTPSTTPSMTSPTTSRTTSTSSTTTTSTSSTTTTSTTVKITTAPQSFSTAKPSTSASLSSHSTAVPSMTSPTTSTSSTMTTSTTIKTTTAPQNLPTDCKAILNNKTVYGYRGSGVYTIHPADLTFSVKVVCDMDTQGGGWTIFQSRHKGHVSFNRSMAEYENGFGSVYTEYWVGLKALHAMTKQGGHQLLWQYKYEDGDVFDTSMRFNSFSVGPGPDYRLFVQTDNVHFTEHDDTTNDPAQVFQASVYPDIKNGSTFSTYDRDDFQKCAAASGCGYWFPGCFFKSNTDFVNIFDQDLNGQTSCTKQDHDLFRFIPYCTYLNLNAKVAHGVGYMDVGTLGGHELNLPLMYTKMMFK